MVKFGNANSTETLYSSRGRASGLDSTGPGGTDKKMEKHACRRKELSQYTDAVNSSNSTACTLIQNTFYLPGFVF